MEVAVAEIDEVEPGSMLAVSAAGRDLVLFRHADGSFSTLDDCCSHDAVALSEGQFENGIVECPAHGAKFDARNGGHLCLPALRGVQNYEVCLRGGKVMVVLPDEVEHGS